MSKEDFHKDLISRLDPETVQKALERYNRKNSTVGVQIDNEEVISVMPNRNMDSLPSTPRYIFYIYINNSITLITLHW